MDIGACKKRLFELACERGTPLPFKAFPPWGKVDCRSFSEGKTDEGSGYDKRNVKDNPSSVATRQLPPKGKP